MRYKGTLSNIRELDKVIAAYAILTQYTGLSGDYKPMTIEQSACQRKRYRIGIDSRYAIIKLDFDKRTDEGMVEIRDDNAWHVAQRIPEFATYMARLYPVYHRRGEMLQAMDKFMGVQNEQKRIDVKQAGIKQADVLNEGNRQAEAAKL